MLTSVLVTWNFVLYIVYISYLCYVDASEQLATDMTFMMDITKKCVVAELLLWKIRSQEEVKALLLFCI